MIVEACRLDTEGLLLFRGLGLMSIDVTEKACAGLDN
jgi:hypothetical protein